MQVMEAEGLLCLAADASTLAFSFTSAQCGQLIATGSVVLGSCDGLLQNPNMREPEVPAASVQRDRWIRRADPYQYDAPAVLSAVPSRLHRIFLLGQRKP